MEESLPLTSGHGRVCLGDECINWLDSLQAERLGITKQKLTTPNHPKVYGNTSGALWDKEVCA